MMRPYLLLVLSLSLVWQAPVWGHRAVVTFEQVFESCKTPFETADFDPDWESRLGLKWDSTTYYAPVASAGDIYRVTQQFMGKNNFSNIRMSHLENSCFRIKKNDASGSSRTFLGFGNKHFVKKLTPVPNKQKTVSYPAPFPGNFGATLSISMSDNLSYTLVVLCHADGLGSWAALSPFKKLPAEDIKVIKSHIKALGFDEKKMINLDYTGNCDTRVVDVPS